MTSVLAGRPIKLPMLGDRYEISSCKSLPNRCRECALYKRECGGCSTSFLGKCAMASSQGSCDACTGFRSDKDENVQAVCCKSPTKDYAVEYIREWWEREPEHKVEPIELGDPWIMQVGNCVDAKRLPPQHTYTVGMHEFPGTRNRKLTIKGSARDYFGIPKGAKFIAHGVINDVFQERIGEQLSAEVLTAKGVDYWTPMAWSIFDDAGSMFAAYNYAKVIRSLIVSKAHFTFYSPHPLARVQDPFRRCLERVQNVVSEVRMATTNREAAKEALRSLLALHRELPKRIPFFLYGVFNPTMTVLRREMKGRNVYGILHARSILIGHTDMSRVTPPPCPLPSRKR